MARQLIVVAGGDAVRRSGWASKKEEAAFGELQNVPPNLSVFTTGFWTIYDEI